MSPGMLHSLEKTSGFYMDIYIKNQTIFDAKYPHETQESIIFEKVPAAITTLS
jgi:hypothetical protein